jgi:uncharacterized membrane-anchored protein YjiN (DUF445 family)
LIREKNYTAAEHEIRLSLDIFAKALPSDHQYVASSEHLLGELLMETNRLNDAEATLTAAMNRWKRTDAPAWRSARSASALGEVLYKQGRIGDAEHYLVESYRAIAVDSGADRDTRTKVRERVSRFYTDRGQRNKLDELVLATSGVTPRSNGRPN